MRKRLVHHITCLSGKPKFRGKGLVALNAIIIEFTSESMLTKVTIRSPPVWLCKHYPYPTRPCILRGSVAPTACLLAKGAPKQTLSLPGALWVSIAVCWHCDVPYQEVELLTLYKAIVDNGPDLFSLHRVDLEAPFR